MYYGTEMRKETTLEHILGIVGRLFGTGLIVWVILCVLQFLGCLDKGKAYGVDAKPDTRSTLQRLQEERYRSLTPKSTVDRATKDAVNKALKKPRKLLPTDLQIGPFPWQRPTLAPPLLPPNCPWRIHPLVPELSPPGSNNNPLPKVK